MTEPQPGVSAPVALAFGTVGFFALVVAGFGLLSLATGDEVLPVTGLGPLPGIAAVVFAVAAFVLTVWAVVRRPAPRYTRGVLAKFFRNASSASRGAVLDSD